MSTQPGEVWLADLGIAGKVRPVIIVSRADNNLPRQLVLYVPLTTQDRHSAYEVGMGNVPFLDQQSVANVQGLSALPIGRLERRLGRVPDTTFERIKQAIRFAMEL